MKALACELLGDWAAASENYEKAASLGYRRDALEEARLASKKGEKAAAFEAYCAYLEEIAALNPNLSAEELAALQKEARVRVMCEHPYPDYCYRGESFDGRVLCPFADYASFLSFMETEFKAQGEPAEKVPTMEFFRSLTEIEADAASAT